MNQDHRPSVWATADPPVVAGPRSAHLLTMADLAGGPGLDRAIDLLRPLTGTTRKAAITAVHYALWTAVSLVIEPFAAARVAVDGDADQFGFSTDDEFNVLNFWVGDVTIDASTDSEAAGTRIGTLLRPVIEGVRRRARVGTRGLELVVLDSMISQCRQLERRERGVQESAWADRLVAATGLQSDVPQRNISVTVDAGPPVEFPVPRVCCVLSSKLGDHACPTCPLRVDDEARRQAVATWLAEMSDADFADVAGRARFGTRSPTAL